MMLIYLFGIAIVFAILLLILCAKKPEIRDFYIDFSLFPPRFKFRVKTGSCEVSCNKKKGGKCKPSSCVKN